MKTSLKITTLAAIALALLCQTGLSAPQPASHCQNVFAEGGGSLAIIEIAPGVFTLGFPAAPVTLGNVPGMLSSYVTSLEASGSSGQAKGVVLEHGSVLNRLTWIDRSLLGARPLVMREMISAQRMIAPLSAAIHCAGTPASVRTFWMT